MPLFEKRERDIRFFSLSNFRTPIAINRKIWHVRILKLYLEPLYRGDAWRTGVPARSSPQGVVGGGLKRTELALSGLSMREIIVLIKTAVQEKEFVAPEIGAMSYMMSRDQYHQ